MEFTAEELPRKVKFLKQKMNQKSSEYLEQLNHKFRAKLQQVQSKRDCSETWIHLDIYLFCGTVEARNNPDLKNKPIVVVSNGLVVSFNALAAEYSVKVGMLFSTAKLLCNSIVFVPENFTMYQEEFSKIKAVLRVYDPNFEYKHFRKVFLNVSQVLKTRKTDLEEVCEEIKFMINQLSFQVSIGAACNKMLARIASSIAKPDSVCLVPHESTQIVGFMEVVPVGKVPGINKAMAYKLRLLGIYTCGDILNHPKEILLGFTQDKQHFLIKVALGMQELRCSQKVTAKLTLPIEDPWFLEEAFEGLCSYLAFKLNLKNKDALKFCVTLEDTQCNSYIRKFRSFQSLSELIPKEAFVSKIRKVSITGSELLDRKPAKPKKKLDEFVNLFSSVVPDSKPSKKLKVSKPLTLEKFISNS